MGKCNCKMIRPNGRKIRECGSGIDATSREYRIWVGIRYRVSDGTGDTHKSKIREIYKDVTISEDWAMSYLNFEKDMGKSPGKTYSVDRINNKRGYCKHNCRWATPYQQVLNRNSTKFKDINWTVGVKKRSGKTKYTYQRTHYGRDYHLGDFTSLSAAFQAARIFEFFEKKSDFKSSVILFRLMMKEKVLLK